ncbi:pyridoxal phosphate-dependent transferase [Pilobolus umbonatus]|nr:pyridoxal phosphate-dependent transferase [Pilobolus umbonatus]
MRHPQYNPDGALNLGVAHNSLLQEVIFKKSKECLVIEPNDVNYGSSQGSRELRSKMISLLTKYFKPHFPLEEAHITCQPGASSSVNQLLMSITDKDDYVMIPTPYYGAFDTDVSVNTGAHILPVKCHTVDDLNVSMDRLEEVYQSAISEGKRVVSILICNPYNPVGRCYTLDDIHTFLRFASDHNLHACFDEIYALSSFGHVLEGTENPFKSVLSIDYSLFIDPALVHVIYGLSKDFAINGYRVGFIIDQFNKELAASIARSGIFSYISTITDRFVCNFLADEEWIEKYLENNRKELALAYKRATQYLDKHNIRYIPAVAGHFLMIDLLPYISNQYDGPITFNEEKRFLDSMLDCGVYLAPGIVYHTETPGLFRMTFSISWDIMQEGLDKLEKLLTMKST